MDPTVRQREEGSEGECNYQLAKCIHNLSQKDWDVGGRETEQERVKEVKKWGEIWRGGGTQSEGLLAKWMQGHKQG